MEWRALDLRPAAARRQWCGTRSSHPPAPGIRRARRRPPRLLPGPLALAPAIGAPSRPAADETPASLILTKFGVTAIASVGGRSIGGCDRSLVAGLDRRHELRSRRLHRRDQLIDVIRGGEDLRFNFAPVHVRTGQKQGPVE